MKTFIQTSKVLILSIAVLTVLGYAQAAWEAPSGEPSASNNAPAPINVSSSNQDKLGGFAAASLVADVITSPKFCLPGDDCITEWPIGGGSGGGVNQTLTRFTSSIILSDGGGTVSINDGDYLTNNETPIAGTGVSVNGRTVSVDEGYVQKRVASSCPSGQAIRAIYADGTVLCQKSEGGGSSVSGSCPSGQAISGISSSGRISCTTVSGDGGGTEPPTSSTYSKDCSGSGSCRASCNYGDTMVSWICSTGSSYDSFYNINKTSSGRTGSCSYTGPGTKQINGYGSCK